MSYLLRTYLLMLCLPAFIACQTSPAPASPPTATSAETFAYFDRDELIATANSYLSAAPVPLTAAVSERSAGGPRDFYSEGDYWWPDPENPTGPYIRSTWWAAQVAAFASLTGREAGLELAREAYKSMLTVQMDSSGGFPLELERTKPYIYTLFNLEGFAVLADYGSQGDENLWTYETADGDGSLRKAFDFMAPYLTDKADWPYPPDVAYYDEVPIQSPGLLLAATAYPNDDQLMKAWDELSPERKSQEIERNFPIRRPLLWVE